MSTDLEKYLKHNRPKLDIESPDDAIIWKGISDRLTGRGYRLKQNRRRISVKRILNIAALILLVFSLGYITKDIIGIKLQKGIRSLSGLNEELGRREHEYRKLLDYKYDELRSLSQSENPIIMELFQEIERLDIIYDQSIKDLNELGNNEKIINTIFDIYEKKIYLLELIILETNKINSHEERENINL